MNHSTLTDAQILLSVRLWVSAHPKDRGKIWDLLGWTEQQWVDYIVDLGHELEPQHV